MNCPDCGKPIEKDAKFCPKCYARIEPPGLLRRVLNFFQSAAKPGAHVIKFEKKVTITTVDTDGNRHEYHSMDEVPPAMRSQIEKLEPEVKKESNLFTLETLKELKGTPGIISKKSSVTYKIKDSSGQEHIYHSLDGVPPEMRSLMEKMQSGAITAADLLSTKALEEAGGASSISGKKNFEVYKFKDVSGQERTCHSLDELPSEIREAIKRIQSTK